MIYLFNPDNDLALANFSPHYTPPASALKIAEDLAMLPLWFAPDGAKIVAEGAHNQLFLSEMKRLFSVRSSLVSLSDISLFSQEEFIPWGWNPSLRKKLTEAGVSEEKLLSMNELKRLRAYSGRQNAISVLNQLMAENKDYCGESHLFTSVEELLQFLASKNGDKVLKMPNSGSGKGLVWIKGEITDKQTDWSRRVIREQGGVVAEPVLHKVQDFAMEFFAENGNVCFAGYSLFHSAASGAYSGNILLSDADIEKALAKYVEIPQLHTLRETLIEKLARQFPHYKGYLGVDMMICRTRERFQIQPCVEINVRMNMGMVARLFYDRFVSSDSTGEYRVNYFKNGGDALRFYRKMQTENPLLIEDRKVASGFLSLTPVLETTHYVAWTKIIHT